MQSRELRQEKYHEEQPTSRAAPFFPPLPYCLSQWGQHPHIKPTQHILSDQGHPHLEWSFPPPHQATYVHITHGLGTTSAIFTSVIQFWFFASYPSSTSGHHWPIIPQSYWDHNPSLSPLSTVTCPTLSQLVNFYSSLWSYLNKTVFPEITLSP